MHYAEILRDGPGRVDFVELITENFLGRFGRPVAVLERLRKDVPVSFHGVSMSLGSVDGPDDRYLEALGLLAGASDALSDHACFSRVAGHYSHDLWPLPHTEEALEVFVNNVNLAQDVLGRQIAIENVSRYVDHRSSEMSEWEFLAELTARTGCGILLDVNNIIVTHKNFGISVLDYIQGIPVGSVREIHVAGHRDLGTHVLDNHEGPVPSEVWDLYGCAIERFGAIPTVLEWDENTPSYARLLEELDTARDVAETVLQRAA